MTVLEGSGVRLRPLRTGEYAEVYGWYTDPELVAPFDRFSTDTFEEFVRAIERSPDDPTSLAPRFAVAERTSDGLLGVVGFYAAHPVLEFIDVWYVLGNREARGHGYGREAVGLMVGHLFRARSVERIGATADVDNVASYRLLERLGFRREGTLRSALFHHGRWHDVFVYGVTRSEWATRTPPS